MVETFTRTFPYQKLRAGSEIRKAVMAAEKEAEEQLGGPVGKTHRLVGEDIEYTWRLK